MRVKVGSVAFLKAAGSGYGIGLDDDGHRIEFMGDWRALSQLSLGGSEPVYADVDSWQVIAVDDELRVDLSRDAIGRARRIRALRPGAKEVGAPRMTPANHPVGRAPLPDADRELVAQEYAELLLAAIEAIDIAQAHARLAEAAAALSDWSNDIRERARYLVQRRLNQPREPQA